MRLVIYGVGSSYVSEALESARRLGWEVVACVRNLPDAEVPQGLPGVIDVDAIGPELLELPFVVALTTPGHRHAAVADARAHGFTEPATMIDPTAVVAASATLGDGAYVNAGAIVAAGVTTGESLVANRGSSIGHHSHLEAYVSVGPGAVTGGECRIGRGAFLGVGAMLAPGVRVGSNATVGAGAVVISDVGDGETVVGNPARPIERSPGHGGVLVPAEAV